MSRPIGAFIDRNRLVASRWSRYALVLAVLCLLSACDVKREWKEQVKLADGTVIVVGRSSLRERFGELGSAGYGKFKEEVLLLQDLNALEWRGDTIPLALEIVGRNAYVIGWLRGWDACARYGYPNPPFVYFRSTAGGAWEQIDPSMSPVELRPNLLLNPWQESLGQLESVVDLQAKARLNESVFRAVPGLKEFRTRGTRVNGTALVKCVRPRAND